MYCALHLINTSTLFTSIKVGFKHLPLLPEQITDSPQSSSMSLELMKKGIQLVVEFLGRQIEE